MSEIIVNEIKDVTKVKSYIPFSFECPNCKVTVTGEVDEMTILGYKMHNLGPMQTKRNCPNCGHSIQFKLRLK